MLLQAEAKASVRQTTPGPTVCMGESTQGTAISTHVLTLLDCILTWLKLLQSLFFLVMGY